MDITNFILGILASNAVLGIVEFLIMRYFNGKDLIKRTLAALSYNTLADKIEKSLDKNYATPEQRRDISVLHEVYGKNGWGWNGDMDSRIHKFYSLPTKDLDEVYPTRKTGDNK